MFIDEGMNVEINANLNETVVRATHRPQDLVPAFLDVITNTAEYAQLVVNNAIPSYAMDDDDAEYWDSEDCMFFLDDLFNVLDQYSPDGYYFGAHPGDGSDFGYWKNEE